VSDSSSTPAAPSPDAIGQPGALGMLAFAWGLAGFVALLLFALWRLVPLAFEAFQYPWGWAETGVFVANLAAMAWYEGYKGFQNAYSPRFAARCHHLLHHAGWRRTLLAPLVAMGFLAAPRRRVIAAWALTVGIVAVVLLYRLLPQPWRGILDAGVVVGLAWGLVATVLQTWRTLRDGPAVNPEIH